ncbi:MAG TPA: NAD(P)H-dependent oxidoreductase subunit E [Dehalococcoidia bacterium]|nr:NAD(P)H-dependent oxidoreductase subunit E [Dehalococcoidia bacterium]
MHGLSGTRWEALLSEDGAAAARGSALDAAPRARSQLLPRLLDAQERDGFVSEASLAAIARDLHVPESEAFGVATSYSELRMTPRTAPHVSICTGLSCLLNGARALADALPSALPSGWQVEEEPCRFRCDAAPIAMVGQRYVSRATADGVAAAVAGADDGGPDERPTAEERPGETRRLLGRCGRIDPDEIDGALALGAYDGWQRARSLAPTAIVAIVEASGLRGRGGAYFPAATKWRGVHAHPAPRYLVVNAEEGEPGVFKDRYLIEGDPHLVVEGILIAARAVEAARVYVYVNGEARLAAERLRVAIARADARGLLTGAPPIEVRRGAGGYVCGEESVILSSIEGERAVPRLRPPFPVDAGLFGRPTVINNVETLCNLPQIVIGGGEAFRATGTAEHPGTKLVCLSGAFARPGVYEVPFGTPLRRIVGEIGGGAAPGRTLRALLCGGPSGSLLPPSCWDAPLVPNGLDDAGASPGAGGIVAIDEMMSIREVVRHLAAYNAAESCGKCTPCREGTVRMVALLDERPGDARARMDDLTEAMGAASLCGLGQMAPLPYLSARRHFGNEL